MATTKTESNLKIKQSGFIKIPRRILNLHFNGDEEMKLLTEVYLFLHTKAFFTPNDITIGRKEVFIDRGECYVQKLDLMRVMNIGRTRLENIIDKLVEFGWIELVRKENLNIFKITEYDMYPSGTARAPRTSSTCSTSQRSQTPWMSRTARMSRTAWQPYPSNSPSAPDKKLSLNDLPPFLGSTCVTMYDIYTGELTDKQQ